MCSVWSIHRYIEVFQCNSSEIKRMNSNPGKFRGGMNRPGPYDRASPMGMGRGGRMRSSGFERRSGGYGGNVLLECLFNWEILDLLLSFMQF